MSLELFKLDPEIPGTLQIYSEINITGFTGRAEVLY
jgi:hypothetical protein